MKFPYLNIPPPKEQVMAHDHQRFVVQLNQVGLAQLQRFPDNPGIVAFATGVGGGVVVAENLIKIKDDLVQVQTCGIHHDWIWAIEDDVRYVVLVWPFHAPMSWQIVGYRMTADIEATPVSWSDFQSFKYQKENSIYDKEISSGNGHLREADAN